MRVLCLSGAACLIVAGAAGAHVGAQAPAAPPAFTAAQADTGQRVYQTRCGACHADDLGGRDDAPALKGEAFLTAWGARSTTDLLSFMRTTMPPDGSVLTADEYLAVLAYVLQQNGAAPGEAPLTAGTAATIRALTPSRER